MLSIKKIFGQYTGLWESISTYWKTYGGFRAIITSPYFFIALLVTIACFPVWGEKNDLFWYEICLSVIPNLLGFTLGGYAMLLAFGDDRFRKSIAGPDEDETSSPFMDINATFIHFILMQALSLFLALIGLAWGLDSSYFAFFGFGVFIYSLSTAIAAAFAIFRVSEWYDHYAGGQNGDGEY